MKKKTTERRVIRLQISVDARDLGLILSAAMVQVRAMRIMEQIGLGHPEPTSSEVMAAIESVATVADAARAEAGIAREEIAAAVNAKEVPNA